MTILPKARACQPPVWLQAKRDSDPGGTFGDGPASPARLGTQFYPPAISEKNNSIFFSMPFFLFVKGDSGKKPIKFLTNPAVMEFLSPSSPLGNTEELVQ